MTCQTKRRPAVCFTPLPNSVYKINFHSVMPLETEKVYYSDPYLTELDAKVLAVYPDGLVLDRTVFYPEGGGQRGDSGLISGIPVTSTVCRGGETVHLTEGSSAFHPGDSVRLLVDWPKRYNLMKAHTAQHMIAGLAYTHFQLDTVAIHLGDDELTVEFVQPCDDSLLYELESLVNEHICSAEKVTSRTVSHEEAVSMGLRRSVKVTGPVRLVSIDNTDLIACGGLHVSSAAEVGLAAYAGQEKIRGHVRTFWHYADNAFRYNHANREIVMRTGALLSAPADNVVCALETVLEEVKALRAELRTVSENAAASFIECCPPVFDSPFELSAFQKCAGRKQFFALREKDGVIVWLLSGSQELFNEFRTHFSALKISGGGRAPLFQGRAQCSRTELMSVVSDMFEKEESNE